MKFLLAAIVADALVHKHQQKVLGKQDRLDPEDGFAKIGGVYKPEQSDAAVDGVIETVLDSLHHKLEEKINDFQHTLEKSLETSPGPKEDVELADKPELQAVNLEGPDNTNTQDVKLEGPEKEYIHKALKGVENVVEEYKEFMESIFKSYAGKGQLEDEDPKKEEKSGGEETDNGDEEKSDGGDSDENRDGSAEVSDVVKGDEDLFFAHRQGKPKGKKKGKKAMKTAKKKAKKAKKKANKLEKKVEEKVNDAPDGTYDVGPFGEADQGTQHYKDGSNLNPNEQDVPGSGAAGIDPEQYQDHEDPHNMHLNKKERDGPRKAFEEFKGFYEHATSILEKLFETIEALPEDQDLTIQELNNLDAQVTALEKILHWHEEVDGSNEFDPTPNDHTHWDMKDDPDHHEMVPEEGYLGFASKKRTKEIKTQIQKIKKVFEAQKEKLMKGQQFANVKSKKMDPMMEEMPDYPGGYDYDPNNHGDGIYDETMGTHGDYDGPHDPEAHHHEAANGPHEAAYGPHDHHHEAAYGPHDPEAHHHEAAYGPHEAAYGPHDHHHEAAYGPHDPAAWEHYGPEGPHDDPHHDHPHHDTVPEPMFEPNHEEANARYEYFNPHRPWATLTPEQKAMYWEFEPMDGSLGMVDNCLTKCEVQQFCQSMRDQMHGTFYSNDCCASLHDRFIELAYGATGDGLATLPHCFDFEHFLTYSENKKFNLDAEVDKLEQCQIAATDDNPLLHKTMTDEPHMNHPIDFTDKESFPLGKEDTITDCEAIYFCTESIARFPPHICESVVNKVDNKKGNGDGFISGKEMRKYKKMMKRRQKKRTDRRTRMFEEADRDGDALLDLDEFTTLCHNNLVQGSSSENHGGHHVVLGIPEKCEFFFHECAFTSKHDAWQNESFRDDYMSLEQKKTFMARRRAAIRTKTKKYDPEHMEWDTFYMSKPDFFQCDFKTLKSFYKDNINLVDKLTGPNSCLSVLYDTDRSNYPNNECGEVTATKIPDADHINFCNWDSALGQGELDGKITPCEARYFCEDKELPHTLCDYIHEYCDFNWDGFVNQQEFHDCGLTALHAVIDYHKDNDVSPCEFKTGCERHCGREGGSCEATCQTALENKNCKNVDEYAFPGMVQHEEYAASATMDEGEMAAVPPPNPFINKVENCYFREECQDCWVDNLNPLSNIAENVEANGVEGSKMDHTRKLEDHDQYHHEDFVWDCENCRDEMEYLDPMHRLYGEKLDADTVDKQVGGCTRTECNPKCKPEVDAMIDHVEREMESWGTEDPASSGPQRSHKNDTATVFVDGSKAAASLYDRITKREMERLKHHKAVSEKLKSFKKLSRARFQNAKKQKQKHAPKNKKYLSPALFGQHSAKLEKLTRETWTSRSWKKLHEKKSKRHQLKK